MIERYRCPYCQVVCDIELARVLADGETDLRGTIAEHQKFKLDLPERLIITCHGCGREFVIVPSGPGNLGD